MGLLFWLFYCSSSVLILGCITSGGRTPLDKLHCDVFHANCDSSTQQCSFDAQVCEVEPGIPHGCYALWSNNSITGVKVIYKGCWSTVSDCVKGNECVAVAPHSRSSDTYFCCCTRSRCNEKFSFIPDFAVAASPSSNVEVVGAPVHWFSAAVFALLPITVVAVIIFISYWMYRRCRLAAHSNRSELLSSEKQNDHLNQKLSGQFAHITLIDIKARGRYGCVWRGMYDSKLVAVKTLPAAEEDSWLKEQEIYSMPGMKSHPNILYYFGAQYFPSQRNAELWLITTYHDRGSLYDYLKSNELSLTECLKIAIGMLKGLAFLHEEVITPDGLKCTVAHRDFKSRNVLLTNDLDACIADFGLSLKCNLGNVPNQVHAQVGTHRYLAPEILEGATEFTAFAFRQIDCYAAALVIWELASRCNFGEKCPNYRLPYEEEVGLLPDLSTMQDLVVERRHRPHLKDNWKHHPVLSVFIMTMEEMWDYEAEARITASCACERFERIRSAELFAEKQHNSIAETVPFISQPTDVCRTITQ